MFDHGGKSRPGERSQRKERHTVERRREAGRIRTGSSLNEKLTVTLERNHQLPNHHQTRRKRRTDEAMRDPKLQTTRRDEMGNARTEYE
jgi:hypothetical protein